MSEEHVIRDARDEDGAQLCALIEPIFAEYEGVIFDLEEMPELLQVATAFKSEGGGFWSAFRGEQLVGCVGWTPAKTTEGAKTTEVARQSDVHKPGKRIELKKLYVARSERGRGLGGILCDRVEAAARAHGASLVELWSDVKFLPAHRFYERRGYQRGIRTRALNDCSDTTEHYFCKVL